MNATESRGKQPLALSWRVALAAILLVGGWLRFYRLDVPSLWPDEMLVALMASFPPPYIAKWALALEVHPPTYHYFYSLIEQFGLSDFALRLPSALAGTASVWLAWRAGRLLFGEGAGLFAAALLAGNPLHVWLSRQVRPYALMVFFFLLAFIHLALYIRTGDRRRLWTAMLANLPLLLTHYISILIVGAEGALLAAAALPRLSVSRAKDLLLFAAVSLASFAPVLPFFLTMMARRQDMNARVPFDVVLDRTLEYAQGLFNLFSHPALTWALIALWAAGIVLVAARARERLGWLAYCLGFMALPFAVILYQRYNTFYFSSHISFMLPAVVLPAGCALAMITPRARLIPPAAALTAAALAALILTHDHARLYREDSTIITWWQFGTFKAMARELPAHVRPTDQLVFSDMTLPNSINWYLRRFSAVNPVESPRLGPDGPAVVHFLSNGESVGNLFDSSADVEKTGRVLGRWKLDALNATTVDIPRQAVPVVGALPFEFTVTGHPGDFFSKVRSMEGLAVKPDWGGSLHPSRYRTPGWADFEFVNGLGEAAMSVTAGLSFENIGEGDAIALEYSVDGGPAARADISAGPDRNRFVSVPLAVAPGWKRLSVRVFITCAGRTPYGYGGSLQTVQLKSLRLWACPPGETGPCDQRVFEAQVRMAQQGYLGIGFAKGSSALEQSLILPESGVAVHEEGPPGWKVLSPDAPDKQATVTVKASALKGGTVFYPRTGGGSFVSVRLGGPAGTELFRLTGLHGSWTPMAAMYPLALPEGQDAEVSVTLSGQWAQLWVYGGSALFRQPR